MADDPESPPEDEREIELSAITAIFPEIVLDPTDPFSASIAIPVSSEKPIPIALLSSPPAAAAADDDDDDDAARALPTPPLSEDDGRIELSRPARAPRDGEPQDVRYVSHLPPLLMRVRLPPGYPEKEPPMLELSTTPAWLSPATIQRLTTQAVGLWEELGRSPVVFTCIDYLRQAAEGVFGRMDGGEIDAVRVAPDIQRALVDFDVRAKREKFDRETFECGICLGPKKGSSCHRMLRCGHVFCIQCLQDFYQTCITEGDVAAVKCLDPGCGKDETTRAAAAAPPPPAGSSRKRSRRKEDRTLGPNELIEMGLDQETVGRYVQLKRKARLESDKNVVYCPRQWCQGPARWKRSPRQPDPAGDDEGSDEDDEEEDAPKVWKNGDPEEEMPPPSERVAVCEDCSYAFCRVCLSGWHGELTRCWPRKIAELNAEEQASADYLREHSSSCPTCSARCQKTMGCNHMICFKCQSHFCYLCSAWLDSGNPYQHYNVPAMGCYGKLWVLEGGDGHDAPVVPDVLDALEDDDDPQLPWAVEQGLPPWLRVRVEGEPRRPEPPPPPALDGDPGRRDVEHLPLPLPPPPAPEPPRHAGPGPMMIGRARRAARRDPAHPPDRARPPPAGPPRADAGVRGPAPGRRPGGHAPGDVPEADPARGGAERPRHLDLGGLRHFLDLVNNDEEDEWDSDELGDDGDFDLDWEIPIR